MHEIGSPRTTAHDTRRAAYEELQAVIGGLISEFSGQFPAGMVIGQLARAREQLLGSGVRSGLAVAAESMARARLRELIPVHAGP